MDVLTKCLKALQKNNIMNLLQEQHQDFLEWMMSDNVVKINTDGRDYWTSQDSQYRNKLYTMQDAWNYFKREFLTN